MAQARANHKHLPTGAHVEVACANDPDHSFDAYVVSDDGVSPIQLRDVNDGTEFTAYRSEILTIIRPHANFN